MTPPRDISFSRESRKRALARILDIFQFMHCEWRIVAILLRKDNSCGSESMPGNDVKQLNAFKRFLELFHKIPIAPTRVWVRQRSTDTKIAHALCIFPFEVSIKTRWHHHEKHCASAIILRNDRKTAKHNYHFVI